MGFHHGLFSIPGLQCTLPPGCPFRQLRHGGHKVADGYRTHVLFPTILVGRARRDARTKCLRPRNHQPACHRPQSEVYPADRLATPVTEPSPPSLLAGWGPNPARAASILNFVAGPTGVRPTYRLHRLRHPASGDVGAAYVRRSAIRSTIKIRLAIRVLTLFIPPAGLQRDLAQSC